MKALVKTKKKKGAIEIQHVPVPEVSPNQVLIKVKAAGICGTDIHIWHDKMRYWPPVIMGHEFSGEVVEVGEKVNQWTKGDRVVAEPHTRACGVCSLCRSGNIHLCTHKRSIGWGVDGAFADYIKMPSHLLHRVPEGVSFEQAALCEPTAIVVNCLLLTAKLQAGDIVVVEGAGTIGLLAGMIAKATGAGKIIVTGVNQDEKLRLKKAKQMHLETVNVEKEDVKQKISALSTGTGADLVLEAAGVEASINTAFEITKPLGKVAVLGITGENKVNVCWDEAVFKALNVKFCFSSTFESWERSLSLMSTGTIDTSCLVTHTASLEEWEEVFTELEEGNGIKGIFVF